MADDHSGISAAIRRLLVAHDYEVVGSVEDGARVLEEAARLQPDIILLDLNMPNMNGIDACRKLTCMLPANENHRGYMNLRISVQRIISPAQLRRPR